MSNADKYIDVQLIRSPVGRLPKHKAALATIGLKRLQQQVRLRDNLATRGLLRKIAYLIKVVEGD
jgi:large subunit ribosomal protein L30